MPRTNAGPRLSRGGPQRSHDTSPGRDGSPLVFGSWDQQALMLRMHREGRIHINPRLRTNRLEMAGLVVRWIDGRKNYRALNHRHPAFPALVEVLTELSDAPAAQMDWTADVPRAAIKPASALGHQDGSTFRILIQMFAAGKAISRVTLRRRLHNIPPVSFRSTTNKLIREGILRRGERDFVVLAPNLPQSLRRFVLETAAAYAAYDPRLADRPTISGPFSVGWMPSQDGAARIFGADARLRNLMAVARHGPMNFTELRNIVGSSRYEIEGARHAKFGRGGLVRTWETEEGLAVGLDPAYPLHLPLRRLLLALERAYPLPTFVREWEPPELPARRRWVGDRHASFGDVIQTTILTSIGVHGWTFEALCCEMLSQDRVVVQRVIKRLEDEGVLQADRPRGPGFNVRRLTIAGGFPAKLELDELLRAYVQAWPAAAIAVRRGFGKIAAERPRGKVHLERRGLWPY